MHITLVPSEDNTAATDMAGDGTAGIFTFMDSVTDDTSGAVCFIGPDANREMVFTKRLQEDYADKLDPIDVMDPVERALVEDESHARMNKDMISPILGPLGNTASQFMDLGNRYLFEHHDAQRELEDCGTTINIMVLWTKQAECRSSGLHDQLCVTTSTTTTNMQNLITLALSESNIAFVESGINASLHLVHSYRTDYNERNSDGTSEALEYLKSEEDGVLDDAHTNRRAHDAGK